MSIRDDINLNVYNRSNTFGEDPRTNAGVNNAGHGITATLTRNIFNRSFPDWEEEAKMFATFYGAPMKVVGAGVKNIQGGTKETETFVEYKVGDIITLKIKNRIKVFESRIGDTKIKLQVSLDFPPHGHVDKFIDAGEYEQFINLYKGQLAQCMSKTIYELLRFFFLSSAYGACLPDREYDKLLLKTLMQTNQLPPAPAERKDFLSEVPNDSPLMQFIVNHRDHFKAMSDEMNQKISNVYVFDVADVLQTIEGGSNFNPYKVFTKNEDGIRKLMKCLVPNQHLQQVDLDGVRMPEGDNLSRGRGRRASREKSLKAFSIVLFTILNEVKRPNYKGGQGYCGNTYKSAEANGNSSDAPVNRYPANKGTTIMDKAMNQRPLLTVVCKKENLVLVMSRTDYIDFTSGMYDGYLGSEETTKGVKFESVAGEVSEIILIDGMPCGHAIILDKRMIALIPHLDSSGVDTIAQRLVSVATMHKGLIFGLFDQFVGVRVQMTGYTANAVDMTNIFFTENNVTLFASR